jgi:competence protein ComFC
MFSKQKKRCLSCQNELRAPAFFSTQICIPCSHQIPWITDVVCRACGRAATCADCHHRTTAGDFHLQQNCAAVRYTAAMKRWLAVFKYRGHEQWADVLAEMLQMVFRREYATNIDLLTFVPSSEKREQERTFNQAQSLAERLAVRVHLPCRSLLRRIRHTDKQSLKSRADRVADMKRSFQLDSAQTLYLDEQLQKREGTLRILIVDDVYTTGSTLHQCAKTLSIIDGLQLYGLTWAR